MAIPTIFIPLDRIYHSLPDGCEAETIEKWCERVILPEVLVVLELYCVGKGVENFGSFLEVYQMLQDPSLALAFMPVDQPCLHLPSFITTLMSHVHLRLTLWMSATVLLVSALLVLLLRSLKS